MFEILKIRILEFCDTSRFRLTFIFENSIE